MSCIVYQVDKKTGTKFAYESVSYWDKEKKQPRSKRRYLGKVDPATGEIITSKKAAAVSEASELNEVVAKLKQEISKKDDLIKSQNDEIFLLNKRIVKLEKTLSKISSLIINASSPEE